MSALPSQSAWAERLVAGLASAGVSEAICSPGSRSTPLVLAAARLRSIRLHTIVDERSAAFFALGQARVTGRPSMLICTSGSAGAHYFPAIVEADADDLPLVAVTADRPPNVHYRGANQTVDQQHLFGTRVRAFFDSGLWRGVTGEEADALAHEVIRRSIAPHPGPVHLNVRLEKPLEPDAESLEGSPPEHSKPRFWDVTHSPSPDGMRAVAKALRDARRPLLVCGPSPPAAEADVASARDALATLGLPVVAERTGTFGAGATHGEGPFVPPSLLRSETWLDSMRPDLVLQLGRAPLASETLRALERWMSRLVVISLPSGRPSAPATLASETLAGDPIAVVSSLIGGSSERVEKGWIVSWRDAAARLAGATRRLLGDRSAPLSDPQAAAPLIGRLDRELLVVGNSLPVRAIDVVPDAPSRAVSPVHQRGASGIDGHASLAAGAASKAGTLGRERVSLLLGDVAMFHDLNGLAAVRDSSASLTIVVADNGGGRLFERLPIGSRDDLAEPFRAHFLTPPGVDFASAARTFGLAYHEASTLDELDRLLSEPGDTNESRRMIRATIDPECSRAMDEELSIEAERAAEAAASD